MSGSEQKKTKQDLGQVESDLNQLQELLSQSNIPGGEALRRHMADQGGLLAPLGKMLNELLKDPILRQAMAKKPPADSKKH